MPLSLLDAGLRGAAGGVLPPYGFATQQAIPSVCALLAAWAALAHWKADLLEPRRRLRGFVLVTGVAYTLAMLAARMAAPRGRLPEPTALADSALLAAMLAGIAWQILRVGPSELFTPARRPIAGAAGPALAPALPAAPTGTAPAAPDPHPDPAQVRLAETLQAFMQRGAYRGEDLTIAGLAARLAVPEYRLRRLINQGLGFRNFNAFVNAYRLEDARTALADPSRRETSILAVALDAGFQSIGPFNRAFKASTGLTPSEFRRTRLADS